MVEEQQPVKVNRREANADTTIAYANGNLIFAHKLLNATLLSNSKDLYFNFNFSSTKKDCSRC